MSAAISSMASPKPQVARTPDDHSASNSVQTPDQSLDIEPLTPTEVPYVRIFSVCFCFFIGGVNIGSLGAVIPYMIRDYNVSTAVVSSVFVFHPIEIRFSPSSD
jgi:hypothetical protein